jgi:hypothetical protein
MSCTYLPALESRPSISPLDSSVAAEFDTIDRACGRAAVAGERLCQRELEGRPIYFVCASLSDYLASLMTKRGAMGLANKFIDVWLPPVLKWRGRGVRVLIDNLLVAPMLRDVRERITRENSRDVAADAVHRVAEQIVSALLIHELAHALDCTGHRDVEADFGREVEAAPDADLRTLQRLITAARRDGPEFPAWHQHEADFVRCAIHLHYRSQLLGWSVELSEVNAAGSRYGLSDVGLYRDALGDEPEQWRERSLCELADEPMPLEFKALWLADTQRLDRRA